MKHLGRFYVHRIFFENIQPDEGINLFSRMVILEAKSSWSSPRIEYIAFHADFRLINECDLIPEYEAIFDSTSAAPKWVEKRNYYE